MQWRASNFPALLIHDWDGGEYTVFQPESGKTHFLNRMSIALLAFLNENPATALQVSRHLSEIFEQESDQNFQDNIEKILYHLDTLGLIKKES